MGGIKGIIETVGLVMDAAGVLVIVVGFVVACVRFAAAARGAGDAYRALRQGLGRAILLGLEFLVASDIIRTVAVTPTIQNVLALGLVVLVRTFLSFSLQVELEGKLPWARPDAKEPAA
jgi:uncharacterized membrane protein